jgi:hypothetical protein
MSDRHSAKEVEEAIRYAEERGRVVIRAFGHTHAWSTPRNPHAHAKRIRQVVDGCHCHKG